jgi:hypothetical protein
MIEGIVAEWSNQLKQLLESKHLYQKVDVPIQTVRERDAANISPGLLVHVNAAVDGWQRRPLEAAMTRSTEMLQVGNAGTSVIKPILLVTNMKLFCGICGGAEVYYPLWARDVTLECKDPRGSAMPRKGEFQMFFLAFQCQNCHSDPEAFIVRRSGFRLYLEGRSPIEEVRLPKYIPKKEAHFLSDAVVAFNAGKKLAGLFYLRTFLEQYARRITRLQGRTTGEEIMDAYATTLPVAHRDHMPSFRTLYEKLSEALHEARTDEALFESVRAEIDLHFDIRRVFKIAEVDVKAPPDDETERKTGPEV